MGKLAQRITDTRVLTLVRRYLEAGIMAAGVVMERHEGTCLVRLSANLEDARRMDSPPGFGCSSLSKANTARRGTACYEPGACPNSPPRWPLGTVVAGG